MAVNHLEWALKYAARGWRVFPLTEGDKVPPAGFSWDEEATSDLATVTAWWSEFPNDNIGLACGAASNVFVVDIDSHDAVREFDALCQANGGCGSPLVVQTSKGLHLYFSYVEGLRNTAKRLPGIDTRGEGGYVVAPPSLHPSGTRYTWGREFGEGDLTPPAPWLVELVKSRALPVRSTNRADLPERTHALTREDLQAYSNRKARALSRGDEAAQKFVDAAQAILDGKPWAPVGQRDSVMHEFVGSLGVWVADTYDADIDAAPEALAIFEPSLQAVREQGVKSATDIVWLAGKFAASSAREFHADLQAERAAEVADIEEFFARRDREVGGPDHFKHTDLGNAERLAHRHGDCFRYVVPWGLWYVWDGRRWVKDEKEIRLLAAAKETVRNMYKSASQEPDPDIAKDLRKFAHNSESRASLNNMVALVRSARPPTLHTELDTNPWILNVANGTIDLRTGQLRPHNPEDLCTKISPVHFDSAAKAPTWERFILEVCDGHRELAEYLQRAVGYSLSGDVSEHALFLCHGAGCNGKSVLVGALLALLGEYGGKAPMDLLVKTQNAKHETGIAKLCGLRLAAVTETEEGSSWAESVVKELTGGDTIAARRMREDFWDFRPTHKLWVCANHEPEVRGSDDGIWRRLKKVPFNASFKGREDRGLGAKLEQELPGILAWAVRGCVAWQSEGLHEPADVADATNEYRNEHDTVGRFLTECCVLGEDKRAARQDLYQAFETWSYAQGERAPAKQKVFAKRLRAMGIRDGKVRTPGGPRDAWAGVALASAPDAAFATN